jgi:hypothetical protein
MKNYTYKIFISLFITTIGISLFLSNFGSVYAAVANDVASESHTGTTGNSSAASFTWTHTPVGTPRGVLVFVYTISATQTVTGVTYGGVAMTPVSGGAAADIATEPGRVDVYFLGSSIPTGAKSVVVSRTNNSVVMYATAITQTAAGDTEVAGVSILQNDQALAQQSISDGSTGVNSVRYAGAYSGLAAPPTVGANSTLLQNIDLGNFGASTVRETTAGQGARLVGFTAASDDVAAVHLAVREIPPTSLAQSSYRFFDNEDSRSVITSRGPQDTPVAVVTSTAQFRLRMTIDITNQQLASSGKTLKLQYAQKSGLTCSPGDGAESWADITTSTAISYNDNPSVTEGVLTANGTDDPVYSGHTNVTQTYEELNNFTNSISAIPAGQGGLWDFSLKLNGAVGNASYCIKAVNSDGTDLNSYVVYPEVSTPGDYTLNQLGYRWRNDDGGEASVTDAQITLHPKSQSFFDSALEFNTVGCLNDEEEWDCVNDQTGNAATGEPEANDGAASYLTTVSNSGGRSTFYFDSDLLPAGAIVTSLTITAKIRENTSSGSNPAARLFYRQDLTDNECPTATSVGTTDWSTVATCTFSGLSVSAADMNFIQIGVISDNANDLDVTQLYAVATYSVTGATWKQSENTLLTGQVKNENVRLRTLVQNDGPDATGNINHRLQYALKGASCAVSIFAEVPTSGASVIMTASDFMRDQSVTTDVSGGITNPGTGAFTAGRMVEDTSNTASAVNLALNAFTENEYGIQFTSSAVDGGTYCFRITKNDTAFTGAYTYAEIQLASPPTVTTQSASSITSTSATLNGNITSTGGLNPTLRGFAWGTTPTLIGGDTATTTETGSFSTGVFTNSSLTLVCNTTYYSRAYAVNSTGTSTGAISSSFTTSSCPTAPTVTTQSASSITDTSAVLNGNITLTGGINPTLRGFAWGTNSSLVGGDTATSTEFGSFGTGAFTGGFGTVTYNSVAAVTDIGNNITIDSSNNIYVTGKQGTNGGDAFVRKYNANGVLCDGLSTCAAWGAGSTGTVTYNSGGTQQDQGLGIVLDSSNNIYVTGSQGTNGDDVFVRKYNADGILCDGLGACSAWGTGSTGMVTYNSGGTQADLGFAITIDSSNNIYVTGRQNTNGGDAFVRKYNANGVLCDGLGACSAWGAGSTGTVTFERGTGNDDEGYDVTLDSFNNIYLIGQTYLLSSFAYDLYVRKYNADGILCDGLGACSAWGAGSTGMVTYNSGIQNFDISASQAVFDSSNNIYVVGDIERAVSGANDAFIRKYNANGVLCDGLGACSAWGTGSTGMVTYNSGGTQEDLGFAITIDSSRNVYITGYQTTDTKDVLLKKYNSTGGEALLEFTPNTTYYSRAYATNSVGIGTGSITSFLTLPTVPGNPTASAITATTLTLNWTLPTGGATTYKIERCSGSGCSSFVEIATGVVGLSYNDSGLTAETTYRYRVRGTNATGDGAYATSADITTTAIATTELSAYRFFDPATSYTPGTALSAQDTSSTLALTGDSFRMRLLIHFGSNVSTSERSFKLQYAEKSGTCDIGFTGETYADITAITPISYKDMATLTDNTGLGAAADIAHNADTIVNQTYEEANNFTNSQSTISTGQDGKWDFSLYDNGATSGQAYCLRVIQSDGSLLSSYTQIPEIITAAAASPVLNQLHFMWRNDNGSEGSATINGSEDIELTSSVFTGDRKRLRFLLSNTGTADATNYNYKIEYATASCTLWSAVASYGAFTNEHWGMDITSNAQNGSVTTNSSLTDPSGPTFLAGLFQTSSNQTVNYTLPANRFTELEYSIRSTENVETETSYCFRLTNAGSVTNFVYSLLPKIVVHAPIFRPSGGGGGNAGGEANGTPGSQVGGGNTGGGGNAGGESGGGGGVVGGGGAGGGGGSE